MADVLVCPPWTVSSAPTCRSGQPKTDSPASSCSRPGHFAAMPYVAVPAFIAELREMELIPAMALESAILTATRSGEVIGAVWSEIDLENRLWVIPARSHESCQEHRIPLCDRAIEILAHMSALRQNDYSLSRSSVLAVQ